MLSPQKTRSGLLLTLLIAFTPTLAQATTIVEDPTLTDIIPGVATFQTTGALMDGMTVHAFFATGFNEMVSWVAGVGDSGGAFGTDWSLTVDGDTFNTEWNFTNNTRQGLVGLLLDGVPGLTLFDRTFNNLFGTPGSALGLDFAESPTTPGEATYSQQVAVILPPPVGDLWHVLRVDFDEPILGDWSFFQDTDNDSRRPPPVAEPSTLRSWG